MNAVARSFTLLVLLFATACAAPMQLPQEFVELNDPGEGFRAVTSDDGRLRLRDVSDPTDGGTAEFWADSLRRDLVEQRGYEEVSSGDVKNADGGTGRWLELAANVHGRRVGYLVAVWAVDPWWPLSKRYLRVVEFAAPDPVFRARVDAVKKALETVQG
jgi:hypothetical protein